MMSTYSETSLTTFDNLSLFVSINKINDPIGQVIFCHGYTEHSGRYGELVERLNEARFEVVRYDHRGYGRSDGERAYVDDFDLFLKDLDAILRKYQNKKIPTYLMGSSMGGLIIGEYVIKHQPGFIAGVLMIAPAIKIDDDISPFLRKISKTLAKIAPKLKTVKLESKDLSRDEGVVHDYLKDPLVYHEGAKVKNAVAMLSAMEHIQNNADSFNLPLLVLHGEKDKLADPQGSRNFVKNVSSSDRCLIEFPDLLHEIIREPEKDQVFAEMLSWLTEEKRLLNAPTGAEIA